MPFDVQKPEPPFVRRARPADAEEKGIVPPRAIPIYVGETVMRALNIYTGMERRRRVGGVLVGTPCFDESGPWLHLEDQIAAVQGVGRRDEFTFTRAAWSAIAKELGKRLMVGWYTTRLGTGVSIGAVDAAFHREHFAKPWQVALVIDVESHNLGFFQGSATEIVPTGFFFVR